MMQLTPLPSKQVGYKARQSIRIATKASRERLIPKLIYQTANIEGEDFQNKIDKAFDLLFEAVAKTGVHKF